MPVSPESLAQMAKEAKHLRDKLPHLMRLVEQTIEEGGDTHDLRQEIAETKKALAELEVKLQDEMTDLEKRLEQ